MSQEHRMHPRDIEKIYATQKDRQEDDEAVKRLEDLTFEYIIKHPKRLQEWLDSQNYTD